MNSVSMSLAESQASAGSWGDNDKELCFETNF